MSKEYKVGDLVVVTTTNRKFFGIVVNVLPACSRFIRGISGLVRDVQEYEIFISTRQTRSRRVHNELTDPYESDK